MRERVTRREIATRLLIRMLDSHGDPDQKVFAAVSYANKLIEALRARKPSRGVDNGPESSQPQESERETANRA